MTLRIKHTEYYEWELSNELINLLKQDKDNATPLQNLIDEYFSPDCLSVDQVGDTYYELDEVLLEDELCYT